MSTDVIAPTDGPAPATSSSRKTVTLMIEWLTLAWVLWWSWAYVQSALAQRFPQWFGWTIGGR